MKIKPFNLKRACDGTYPQTSLKLNYLRMKPVKNSGLKWDLNP